MLKINTQPCDLQQKQIKYEIKWKRSVTIYRNNLFFRSSQLLNNQLCLTAFWTEATMTAPISFAHSPFLYQHVPNSPFLLPRRTQITQSPAPFVPDIDTLRENRYRGGVLLQNGKEKHCFGHTIKKLNRNVWCIMFNVRIVYCKLLR